MSYTTKYFAKIQNKDGDELYLLNLQKLNYVGDSTEITATALQPLRLQYRGGRKNFEDGKTIFPSSVNFEFYSKSSDDYTDLFDSSYRDYRLEIVRSNTVPSYDDLLFSTGATDMNQDGTGRTWTLTGSSATVFLNEANPTTKYLYVEVDDLTDFKVVIGDIDAGGFPQLIVQFLDSGDTVQLEKSFTLITKTSDNIDLSVIYSGLTPITRIQMYGHGLWVLPGGSKSITWAGDLDVYQGTNQSLFWSGWVTPENLTRSFVRNKYEISLEANDGLLDLKDTEFPSTVATGATKLIEVIKACIGETGIELDLWDQLNIVEDNVAAPILKNAYVNTRRFIDVSDGRTKYSSCFDTLERVLAPFNCTFCQSEGAWTITQRQEINSDKHSYDYTHLTGATISNNRTVAIGSYRIAVGSDSLSKIAPLKTVELTFQNRNISDSVIANGTFEDLTGWNNGTGTTQHAGFSVVDNRLLLFDEQPFTSPNADHMFYSDSFPLETISTADTLTISMDVQAVVVFSGDSNLWEYPSLRIDLVKPGTTVEGDEFVLTNVTTRYEQTFDITSDTDYYIKVWILPIKPDAVIETLSVYVDNVTAIPDFGDSDLTFDSYYQILNTGSTGIKRYKPTIYFSDAPRNGDLGAIKYNSTTGLTSSWSNDAQTVTGVTLTKLLGYNLLQQSSRYKDVVMIELDSTTSINFNSILSISGKSYYIVGMNHELKLQHLTLELVEVLDDEIDIAFSQYQLLSVDGSISSGGGSSSVSLEGVSSTEFNSHVADNESDFSAIDSRLDTLEANSPITASNGLTLSNKKVRLGGALTGDTSISPGSDYEFNIQPRTKLGNAGSILPDTQLHVQGISGGVILHLSNDSNANRFSFSNTGSFIISVTPTKNDAATQILSRNSSTGVVEYIPTSGVTNCTSGTYTPTGTNVANAASITTNSCQYLRVGDVVTVSGEVDITPTATNTVTTIRLTLPIASDLANEHECAGTANQELAGGLTNDGIIKGDTTNNEAFLKYLNKTSTATANWFFTFTYRVN